jgi:hypothetical protein
MSIKPLVFTTSYLAIDDSKSRLLLEWSMTQSKL